MIEINKKYLLNYNECIDILKEVNKFFGASMNLFNKQSKKEKELIDRYEELCKELKINKDLTKFYTINDTLTFIYENDKIEDVEIDFEYVMMKMKSCSGPDIDDNDPRFDELKKVLEEYCELMRKKIKEKNKLDQYMKEACEIVDSLRDEIEGKKKKIYAKIDESVLGEILEAHKLNLVDDVIKNILLSIKMPKESIVETVCIHAGASPIERAVKLFIENKNKIIIKAPMNSGKTTSMIEFVKEITSKTNYKTIIVLPTLYLVDEIQRRLNLLEITTTITSKSTKAVVETFKKSILKDNKKIFLITYECLKRIPKSFIDEIKDECLFIFDEVHDMIRTTNIKPYSPNSEIKHLVEILQETAWIAMSATPELSICIPLCENIYELSLLSGTKITLYNIKESEILTPLYDKTVKKIIHFVPSKKEIYEKTRMYSKLGVKCVGLYKSDDNEKGIIVVMNGEEVEIEDKRIEIIMEEYDVIVMTPIVSSGNNIFIKEIIESAIPVISCIDKDGKTININGSIVLKPKCANTLSKQALLYAFKKISGIEAKDITFGEPVYVGIIIDIPRMKATDSLNNQFITPETLVQFIGRFRDIYNFKVYVVTRGRYPVILQRFLESIHYLNKVFFDREKKYKLIYFSQYLRVFATKLFSSGLASTIIKGFSGFQCETGILDSEFLKEVRDKYKQLKQKIKEETEGEAPFTLLDIADRFKQIDNDAEDEKFYSREKFIELISDFNLPQYVIDIFYKYFLKVEKIYKMFGFLLEFVAYDVYSKHSKESFELKLMKGLVSVSKLQSLFDLALQRLKGYNFSERKLRMIVEAYNVIRSASQYYKRVVYFRDEELEQTYRRCKRAQSLFGSYRMFLKFCDDNCILEKFGSGYVVSSISPICERICITPEDYDFLSQHSKMIKKHYKHFELFSRMKNLKDFIFYTLYIPES